MLPTFQIYGLRCCADDAVPRSDADSLMDISLERAEQYDELIHDSPEATLSYIDDDDGELITVGSSSELLDRLNELPAVPPAIFDLLIRSEPARSQALKRWAEFLQKPSPQDKGKGKATDDPPAYTPSSDNDLLIDVGGPSQPTSSSNDQPRSAQPSFWANFEEELSKIMHEQPAREPEPQPRVFPCPPPVNENVPSPGEVFTQALEKINWVTNTVRRIGTGLSTQPPSALPVVEKLTHSLQTTMAVLTTQLHHVALEAAQRTRQAAQQSRDVDLAEIEAAKARIQSLAQSLGRLAAQSAVEARNAARDIAGDVRRDVQHGVGEGFGAVAESARTVAAEMSNAGREIGKAVEEAVSKGKGRATPGSTPTLSQKDNNEDEKSTVAESLTEVEPKEMEDPDELMRMMQETFSNKSGTDSEQPKTEEQEVRNFWQQMNKIASNTSPAESSQSPVGGMPGEYRSEGESNRDNAQGSPSFDFWSRMEPAGPHHPRRRPFSWHPHGGFPGSAPRRHHRGRRHGPPSPPPPFENGEGVRGPPSPPLPPAPEHPPFPYGPHHIGHFHGPPRGLYQQNPNNPHHHFRPHSRFMTRRSSPPPPPRSPPPMPSFRAPSPPSSFNIPPPPPPPPLTGLTHRASTSGLRRGRNRRYNREAEGDFDVDRSVGWEVPRDSEQPVRSLRRAHTVIGGGGGGRRMPPPAPFTAPVDLSRSISPAPVIPPIPSPGQHALHRFPSLASLQRMDESSYRFEANAPVNPFATPPRAPSPAPEIPQYMDGPVNVSDRPAPSPMAQAVLVPAPPQPEPFNPSPVHRASTEPVHHLTNPWARGDRMWFNPSVPGRFPSPELEVEHQPEPRQAEPQSAIDLCVAQLAEMGFGDEGSEGLAGLHIVAETTDGDLEKAIEILEEQRLIMGEHS